MPSNRNNMHSLVITNCTLYNIISQLSWLETSELSGRAIYMFIIEFHLPLFQYVLISSPKKEKKEKRKDRSS